MKIYKRGKRLTAEKCLSDKKLSWATRNLLCYLADKYYWNINDLEWLNAEEDLKAAGYKIKGLKTDENGFAIP